MRVPKAAISASRNKRALPRLDKIGKERFVVLGKDLRSWRNLQYGAIAVCASPVGAHAVLAVAGLEMLLIAEIDQGVEIGDTLDPNIAAATAIAAVGAAEFDEFLPPEGEAAISAFPRPNVDFCLIQEAHQPHLR